MSTDIRPELSEKNPYHISRHRYYELKHFVMQYPEWQKAIDAIDSMVSSCKDPTGRINSISDPVGRAVEKRSKYIQNIRLVERTAQDADKNIGPFVLDGIIFGRSYDTVRAKYDLPYGKDDYYNTYRKFFWLLDRAKSTNSYMK